MIEGFIQPMLSTFSFLWRQRRYVEMANGIYDLLIDMQVRCVDGIAAHEDAGGIAEDDLAGMHHLQLSKTTRLKNRGCRRPRSRDWSYAGDVWQDIPSSGATQRSLATTMRKPLPRQKPSGSRLPR
ncbi:hypothetical protein QE435_000479 [Rhizobium sp. SORGH_AS 787]|uniref:Uncharacterized protein n=1 Tax=Agrobacterium larrymoorei TaxID=160699 RepID=A0AAJ2ETC9_9HYPH|nr:hypothetical protein [Rhizobium sp. SORGH_AS_0787]MDR6100212.1 hypothetical protein [Agrobacterium larrymoorei]